ncbi:Splicing factor 3A subunit 3 [Taenia solium]|eukprot:TsM_000782300 transcript=TsM_000782300 gene=TsM_000782300
MNTVLENQRSIHEERERLIDAMSKEMCFKPKTHKEGVNSEFRLRTMFDRYMEITRTLKELYEDKDGLRKQDIQSLSGPNEFNEFYSRLKALKDFHRSHPDELSIPMSVEFERFKEMRENPEESAATMIEFTDEEGYGRFLDLHELYEIFINIKGISKVDYLTYLQTYDKLYEILRERKTASGAYRHYLERLISYLEGYLSRAKPMLDLAEVSASALARFEREWAEDIFPGWGTGGSGSGGTAAPVLSRAGAHLDLTPFRQAEELASLGLDRLKSALLALGLKCGGTLGERAQRLWATKGRALEDLPPEFFPSAKAATRSRNHRGAANAVAPEDLERVREIAMLEACVYQLAEILNEHRAATVENVQRRQARTLAEREEEEDSDAENEVGGGGGAGGDRGKDAEGGPDVEDDDIPYNPKNLPLGWDGKPIPYWLYKLHGLNMYYSCEICGNQTYRGPKAFQRHFSEWRHAHGMRCLGIPNTAHFAHVTKIEEALALWQRIRTTKEAERWRPEVEEEMEDHAGNVVSRKTYEDLKRQGLL